MHRVALGRCGRHHPTVGLHDEQPARGAVTAQARLQPGQVAADGRLDVGVDRGGTGALELPKHGEYLGRGGDVEVRPALFQDGFGLQLVGRVGVGVHKADDDGRHSFSGQPLTHGDDLGLGQGREDRAFGGDTLGDLAPQVPRDQRFVGAGQAVEVRPVAAPQLEDVPETARGDQPTAAAPALQDGVGRNGRAVGRQRDVPVGSPEHIEGRDQSARLIAGSGRNFRDVQLATLLIERQDIGERPPDVYPHEHAHSWYSVPALGQLPARGSGVGDPVRQRDVVHGQDAAIGQLRRHRIAHVPTCT